MGALRSILAVVAAAAALVAPFPGMASAQETGAWTSPTYGFTVTWDPAIWSEDPTESLTAAGPDQLDRLLLLGDLGPMYVEGARRYAGVASDCVSGELALLTSDETFVDPQTLLDYSADGPDASAGAVEATLIQADGTRSRVVGYVQCRRAGADSVAITTLLAPAEDFPAHLAAAEPVLATITPAGASGGHDVEFAALLDQARANPPVAQGLSGTLEFGPGVMATSVSGVSLADFVASATFVNPWDAVERPFDFGFAFRHTGTDQHLRLIIDSGGAWTLQNGLETVDGGPGAPIRSGAGESNTLELAARGNRGWFGLNGQFVAMLDLSGRALPGDVLAASGFFSENATESGATRFTRFSVWPLPVPPGVLEPATFAQWIDAATAVPALAGPLTGSLAETEGSATLAGAGVALADFAAQVRWANPEDTLPWELGVAFRDQPDGGHYRLTFDQTGRWMFGIGTGEKTASGAVPSMRLGPGAQNAVELVVSGDVAGFAVNGVFVSQLDVSEITAPGDVWFGSGFDVAATEPGRETRYRDFTVWPAESLSLPEAGADGESGMIPLPPAVDGAPAPTPIEDGGMTPLPPAGADTGADSGASSGNGVLAVRIAEVDGSGVSGLATIVDTMGAAEVSLALRGAAPGALAVIHEGTCQSLSIDPAYLLDDPDASGRSRTELGVPVGDLLGAPLAIAIYADIATYGEPVACGEIGQG